MTPLKNLITLLLTIVILFTVGCMHEDVIDPSKAEIVLKQTTKLPGGFSIETSVPLDLEKLNNIKKEEIKKLFEKEKFLTEIEIKNDNTKHENTRLSFTYSENQIESLTLYSSDGQPLNSLGSGIYEFDKEVLPNTRTPLYIGGIAKEIVNDYPVVNADFGLSYLDENGNNLAQMTYRLEIHKVNYTIPYNVSPANNS